MKKNLFIILFISVFTFVSHLSVNATNREISYQGQLKDNLGNVVEDGLYNIEFILYNDSVAGLIVWAESAEVATVDGLFSYQIGSINNLSSLLFQQYQDLYLELKVDGESILPRNKLSASPYSYSASELSGYDSSGVQSLKTDSENRQLAIFDSLGEKYITFQHKSGDSAVILPDSAINADEILNETGLTTSFNLSPMTLTNSEMMDVTKVTIETPDDGYIVLTGKCYVLLSGTTGANAAIVQIDENEGGGTQFPYYTIAGLSGYQNSGTNYFPVYVTRVYYKPQGIHTFRLEAKANNPLPAVAQSWDHILTATYYPTSYYGVEAIVENQVMFNKAVPIENSRDNRQIYKVDLRELEIRDKDK